MDITQTGGRVELSMPTDVVRRRGMFLTGFGLLGVAGGGAGMAIRELRIGVMLALLVGIVCLPLGLYFLVFASRISTQRHVEFDRDRQTVVGGRGARTVMFRAIDSLTVLRTGQIHALELVLKNGTTWRLHAESTQNPSGCEGIAQAARQIADATGLPLR